MASSPASDSPDDNGASSPSPSPSPSQMTAVDLSDSNDPHAHASDTHDTSSPPQEPPAAPMPASIDLHPPPPPSPRHRTLDLDEAVGTHDGQQPTPTYRGQHDDDGPMRVGEEQQAQHQRSGEPQGLGVASPVEEQSESSLFVHLGAQHDDGDDGDAGSAPPHPQHTTAFVSGPAVDDGVTQLQQPHAQPTFDDPDGVGALPVVGSTPPIPGDGSTQVSLAQAQHEAQGDVAGDDTSTSPQSLFNFGPPPRSAPPSRGGGMIRFRTLANSNSDNGTAGTDDSPADEESRSEQQQPRGLEPTALAEQLRNMVGQGGAGNNVTNLYLFGGNGANQNAGDVSASGFQRPSEPPRIKQYAYPSHADSDSLAKEIEEFFSYVEAPQVLENKAAWQEWVAGHDQPPDGPSSSASPSYTWTRLPSSARQKHMRTLLGELTNPDPNLRVTASRAFAYLLQGSFADTRDQEHQEHWIKLNAKMAREEGAISAVYDATKRVLWKHDFLSSLPDHVESRESSSDAPLSSSSSNGGPLLTPQSKAEYFDEVNMELILCFTQLYILIETGRRDEEEAGDAQHHDTHASRLSDDLMNLDPPLPVHLWLVVAGLREKNAKGFPVKKLLLCLWKSLLTCLGGFADIERCKALARKIEGLPPASSLRSPAAQWPPSVKTALDAEQHLRAAGASQPYTTAQTQPYHPAASQTASASTSTRLELGKPRKPRPTKATPLDFDCFREELAVKYPTYVPPRRTPADIPIEKVATALEPLPPPRPIGIGGSNGDGGGGQGTGDGVQPGTPAPTPPPSPRPNKQKFQTDQSRPFVFPFSAAVQGDRMVPYSIEEADRLYGENMYVSTEMWQMWRTREELSRDERGISNDKTRGLSSLTTSSDRGAGGGGASSLSSSGGFSRGAGAASSGKPSRSNSHDARGWAGLHALSKLDNVTTAGVADSHAVDTPPPVMSPGGSGSPRFMGGFSGPASEADGSASRIPIDPENSFMTRGEPTYERLQDIEREIQATLARAEGDHLLAVLDNDRFQRTLAILQQQIADVKRLQRIDVLYKAILGHLQSAVVVLLKLLLATVTAQNQSGGPGDGGQQINNLFGGGGIGGGGGGQSGVGGNNTGDDSSDGNAPVPTVEDVDILRHREITTKAVSAVLLLSLKWFKASHAMKFHHLSQFLVDSNCMLLILKMFGLQEAALSVKSVNEAPNFNFFRYCQLEGHAGQTQQEDDAGDDEVGDGVRAAPHVGDGIHTTSHQTAPQVDDGLIHEYSFRNFFSTLNFTKILQKLTKGKVHRILLLVQYKSSAILKRSLKVQHPTLTLYVLKVIKSQVPFCGRKWRQSNMKVITGIYLNCRPDLRDEWLSTDVDADVYESLPQEQALRALVKFYITSRFGADADQQVVGGQQQQQQQQQPQQRIQAAPPNGTAGGDQNALQQAVAEGLPAGVSGDPSSGTIPPRSAMDFFESDVWPPLRRGTGSAGGPGAAAYIPDDIVEGYLGEYEEMLSEVFGEQIDEHGTAGAGVPTDGWSSGKWGLTTSGAATAWNALGEILGEQQREDSSTTDSDTESVASIGELDFSRPNNARGAAAAASSAGEEATSQTDPSKPHQPLHARRRSSGTPGPQLSTNPRYEEAEEDEEEEGRTNWEHLSPKEMRFLSHSAATVLDPTTSPLGSPTMSKNRRLSSERGRRSRRSSRTTSSRSPSLTRSGSDSQPLRPVLDFEAMDFEAASGSVVVEEEQEEEEQEEEEEGVVRHAAQSGGIDEVEHVFGQ